MKAGQLSVICLICLVSLVILRQWKPEWAPILRMSAVVCFFAAIVTMCADIMSSLLTLCGNALPTDQWRTLIKALGIAFLTELCGSVCRDSGEGTLAIWIETAGKLEILILAMPLLQTMLNLISELLGIGGG